MGIKQQTIGYNNKAQDEIFRYISFKYRIYQYKSILGYK